MKKVRVAIVDDEPLARDVLQTYVQKISGAELVGICKNALDAFYLLNKQSIDLLLLDINMPEISGTDFLKTLKNPPRVIFTTAYSEFAVESYELNAIDYLVKPIPFDRFQKAMNKAIEAIYPTAQLNLEKAAVSQETREDRIMFVRSDGKWIKIDITQLWFVEGLKDYIRLWTDDGRITVHSTMKNFEEQLSIFSNFVRVHKSHIVNIEYITEVDGNSIKIKDQLIGIGSTYREEINKLFTAYKFI